MMLMYACALQVAMQTLEDEVKQLQTKKDEVEGLMREVEYLGQHPG